MATLAAIQKQIADLERQAEAIRKADAKAAIATVRQLIAQHQLSLDDVGLADRSAKKGAVKAAGAARRKPLAAKPAGVSTKPAGVPKYRDPKSAKTWTGTGKPPKWIAGAKNRDKFLITAPAAVAPVVAVAPAKRVGRKLAPQTVPAVADTAPKRRAAKQAPAPAPQPLKTDKPAKAKGAAKAARTPKPAAPAPAAAAPAAAGH